MRIQGFFPVLVLGFFGFLLPGRGSAGCFDFSAKVDSPLKAAIPLKQGEDNKARGLIDKTDRNHPGDPDSGQMTWAQARGTIDKPIEKVLELLLDHKNTSSPKVAELTVKQIEDAKYLARHRVSFLIKPFLFVKVRWDEEWAYALSEGTSKDPKRIVISYEKVEGTHYIKHLCGSFVLNKLSPKSTDLYTYEEAIAERRSVDDTENGILGTFKTLRK